jgi:hypothetical protein
VYVFSRVKAPCGTNLALNATTTSQFLTSPDFAVGRNYANNLRCRWVIDGAQYDDQVDVHFVDLDVESSADCSKDKLQIRDVSTSVSPKQPSHKSHVSLSLTSLFFTFSFVDCTQFCHATLLGFIMYILFKSDWDRESSQPEYFSIWLDFK